MKKSKNVETQEQSQNQIKILAQDEIAVIGSKNSRARAYNEKTKESQPNRGSFKKRLSDLLDDGDLDEAVETIRGAMKANKTHWDGVAKRMVEEPDFRIRLEASKTILAYKEGMPVQRQVVMQESFESLRDAIMAAEHSDEAKRIIETEMLTLKNWDSAPPSE